MTLTPQTENSSPDFITFFEAVRLVATDMDGTLTQAEQFTPLLLQTLAELASVSLPVVIVTGRSAGWVSGLVHYLPVFGAIAENGGVFFPTQGGSPDWLVPIADLAHHRQQLAEVFRACRAEVPHLRESADNAFRWTDWTFEVQGLSDADLHRLGDRCQRLGWSFTYSTVQCHIKPAHQDKAAGLEQVLSRHFPHLSAAQVVTVGDSPNDESLFERDRFPCSVGVANLQPYLPRLTHRPAYLTAAAEGAGFRELAQILCQAVTRQRL